MKSEWKYYVSLSNLLDGANFIIAGFSWELFQCKLFMTFNTFWLHWFPIRVVFCNKKLNKDVEVCCRSLLTLAVSKVFRQSLQSSYKVIGQLKAVV